MMSFVNNKGARKVGLSDCWTLVPIDVNTRRNNDVTCRDLVPHPTKYNKDLCRVSGAVGSQRCSDLILWLCDGG
jgi:hypothetical protein